MAIVKVIEFPGGGKGYIHDDFVNPDPAAVKQRIKRIKEIAYPQLRKQHFQALEAEAKAKEEAAP